MPGLSAEQLAIIHLSIEVRKAKAAQANNAPSRGPYVDTADSEGTMSDYDTYTSPLNSPKPGDDGKDSTRAHCLEGSPPKSEPSIAAQSYGREESLDPQRGDHQIDGHSPYLYDRTRMPQTPALGSLQVQYEDEERERAHDTKKSKRPRTSSPSPERKRQRLTTQSFNLNAKSTKPSTVDEVDISDFDATKDVVSNIRAPSSSRTSPSASQIAREVRMRQKSSSQDHEQRKKYVRLSSSEQPLPNTPLYDALYVNPREIPDYSDLGTFRAGHAAQEEQKSQPTQPEDIEQQMKQIDDEPSPEYLELERIWKSYPPPSFSPQTAEEWEKINTPMDVKVYEIQLKQLEDYKLKVKGDIGKYEIDWNTDVIPVWAQPAAYTAFHEWRKQQLSETSPSSSSTGSKASDGDRSETTPPSDTSSPGKDIELHPVSEAVPQATTPTFGEDTVCAQSAQEENSEPSMLDGKSVEQANTAKESNETPQQPPSPQKLHWSASRVAGDSVSPNNPDVDAISTLNPQTPSRSSNISADSSSLHISASSISSASTSPAESQNQMTPEGGKKAPLNRKKQKAPKPPRQGHKNQNKPLGPIPSKIEKPSARMTRSKAKTNRSTNFQKLDNTGRLPVAWTA